MKTAEDLTNKIIECLMDQLKPEGIIASTEIKGFISDFENEVRGDQEQKTKDACFYIVNNAPVSVTFMGGCGIDRIDTIKKINDVETVKEKFELKLGKAGLKEAAELEKGCDISAGPDYISGYIKTNILPGFSISQIGIIREAIEFWDKIILRGPGLKIHFYVIDIDGKSGTLGAAAHTKLNRTYGLPSEGMIGIDRSDLNDMESKGTLLNVLKHEICHVLGFGSLLWLQKGLLILSEEEDPAYIGSRAVDEYNKKTGVKLLAIPVESSGSYGTRGSHWDESVFDNELMTGYKDQSEVLSRMTLASLEDLGYKVFYGKQKDSPVVNEFKSVGINLCDSCRKPRKLDGKELETPCPHCGDDCPF